MRKKSQLARKIESLMKEKGLYAAQLARMSGLEKVYFSDLFKGKSNNPRCENILKIAEALDCSLDYLFSRTPFKESHKEEPGGVPSGMLKIAVYDSANRKGVEEHVGDIHDYWVVPIAQLYSFTTDPHALILLVVRGDSMEPDYMAGERVLIDQSQNSISVDGDYALSGENFIAIKQVQSLRDQHGQTIFNIVSRNPKYASFKALPEQLKIYGRVVGKWKWS